MNRFITEGVVLKNINYADSHKFFTILTKDHGKISALAMGVRKINSRRAGNLDTLNHVSISITESSKGFKTIDEVKSLDSFKESKDNLDTIYYAFKFAEIIDASIESDHNVPEIYSLLLNTLSVLNSNRVENDYLYIWFLLNLGNSLGFRLDIKQCAGCGNLLENEKKGVIYSQEAGGFLCSSCMGFSDSLPPEIPGLFRTLSEEGMTSLDEQKLTERQVLYLKSVLDLHSQSFYTKKSDVNYIEPLNSSTQ